MHLPCVKRGTFSTIVLVFLFLLANGSAPVVLAVPTTRTVTKSADTMDGSCTLTDCSLREAIAASDNGDTINFAPGISSPISLNSVLTINKSLTITGPGAALLAIDGQNSTRVLEIAGGSATIAVVVTGVTIQHGKADQGGGIYVSKAYLSLADSAVVSNSATSGSGYGGGIYAVNSTMVQLSNVTVHDNTTTVSGGGIYSEGSLKLFQVTVSNNRTTVDVGGPGGGGWTNYGQAQLTNVTFSGNTSADNGGGIRNYGSAWLTNVTITGNTAVHGGAGISTVAGTLTVKNTIVSSSNSSDNCYTWGGSIVNGGNNIDSGTSCGFGTDQGSKSSTDPGLAALADNGGPVQTHALLFGSAALNAGSATTCAAAAVSPGFGAGGEDARGLPRRNGYCDIGAFEAQSASLSAGSGSSPQSATINTAFAQPLQVTAKDANTNSLGGVDVLFAAPSSGASAVLSSGMATSDASGNASVTATANAIGGGPYDVTATVNGVAPVKFKLTNNPYPTTTVITSHLPERSYPNQPITVAFTVASANGMPTGNVTVADSTISCTATVAAGSCVLTFTSPGNKALTVTYAGNSSFGPSTSSSVTHTVTNRFVYLPLVLR